MSTALQRTFGHLVAANAVLNGNPPPPPPPLHPAPSTNPTSSSQPTTPPPTDTSIKIIQGRTLTSKALLNAGFRYSRDGNPLSDGRQAWRCVKRSCKCPGRLYTLNEALHSLGKPHNHPPDAADSNAADARSKIKEMASTTTTSNHRIYCAVTGTLPADALALLSSEDTLKKSAQRARRKLNPRPRAPLTLADLHLEPEDCRTLRQADMLLYDNASDQRRVIILATSDNQLQLVP